MEKHLAIREAIERKIAAGEYLPGSKLPTEVELCRQFGAARATIAHALSKLQDDGILFRRRGAGTFVSCQQETGRTKRIGLLIPGIGEGEIFEPICSSIAAHASRLDFRLSWNQLPDSSPEEKAAAALTMCRQYIQEKIDGIFFEPLELVNRKDDTNASIVRLCQEADIAVVLIDSDISFPERSQLDLAGIDNFRAGVLLAGHLLEQGCVSPAFVHRPRSASTTQARAAGFQSVLASRGLSTVDRILETEPDSPQLVEKLIGELHADGVVCGNDYTAALLMKNLLAKGIRIPEQIKITGVDNLKYAHLLSIPLTTLAQPCREIGIAALELMRFRLANPSASHRQILLDCQLIVRDSSQNRSVQNLTRLHK